MSFPYRCAQRGPSKIGAGRPCVHLKSALPTGQAFARSVAARYRRGKALYLFSEARGCVLARKAKSSGPARFIQSPRAGHERSKNVTPAASLDRDVLTSGVVRDYGWKKRPPRITDRAATHGLNMTGIARLIGILILLLISDRGPFACGGRGKSRDPGCGAVARSVDARRDQRSGVAPVGSGGAPASAPAARCHGQGGPRSNGSPTVSRPV